ERRTITIGITPRWPCSSGRATIGGAGTRPCKLSYLPASGGRARLPAATIRTICGAAMAAAAIAPHLARWRSKAITPTCPFMGTISTPRGSPTAPGRGQCRGRAAFGRLLLFLLMQLRLAGDLLLHVAGHDVVVGEFHGKGALTAGHAGKGAGVGG